MKRMIQGLLLAGSLIFGGVASAQGDTQGRGKADVTVKTGGKAMVKDGMVEHMGFMIPADEKAALERLHHINQQEIQLGKLAQQKAQSPEVRSYGEMLVRDHTAADEMLMNYAQKQGIKLTARPPKPMNEMEKRAMAANKAAMDLLQTLSGRPFDAYFLAHMVGDHDMGLGKVMAAQQHFTQAGLSPVLQQHEQAITRHRQQAHSLLGRIGPGAAVGIGGAGDGMDQRMDQGQRAPGAGRMDQGQRGTDTGGAGRMDQGQRGTGDKGTMDPGTNRSY